jgi:S1-C subfamily serine protease
VSRVQARALGAVLAAALLGGVLALGVARGLGWDGSTKTVETVVTPPAAPRVAAVVSAAKPLPGNGFDPARIYATRSPGVVTIIAIFNGSSALTGGEAQGSGFVVSPAGYILTNSHVITNSGETQGGKVTPADTLYVEFQDGDRVPARIVGWDVFDDVGLIRVDPGSHPLDPVPLGDSSRVVVGAPVAAIGSPFGNDNSLSVGVVSATKRSPDSLTSRYSLVDAIQTDAPINHGNSGGPLFDAKGRVIGITAQIRSDTGNADGVGFAVPINSARRSMDQLVAHGKVSYAFVGVTTVDLTPSLARHFDVPARFGAVVASVAPGTPADRAGLRAGTDATFEEIDFPKGGDVIVAIDGTPVRNKEDVVRIVTDRLRPGEAATFTVLRDGKRRAVRIRLGSRARNQ